MGILLTLLAIFLVVAGVFRLVRGDILWGVILILVGLLVGPGGISLLS
jgi:hypothetical protein